MKQKLGKNQKAWIKELESGKHRQCRGYLHLKDKHRHDKFCCLGVYACKVADMDKEITVNTIIQSTKMFSEDSKLYEKGIRKTVKYFGELGTLSLDLQLSLGLNDANGKASVNGYASMDKERQKQFCRWVNEDLNESQKRNGKPEQIHINELNNYNVDDFKLITLNDTYKLKFKEIAYLLKTWPEIWFVRPA